MSKNIFFDRKSIKIAPKKPKTMVFQIYLCCKYISSDDNADYGAWSSLIVQQPQDSFSKNDTSQTFMISGVESSNNHIRIRLIGVIESLNWVTAKIDPSNYSSVDLIFITNDIFISNLLREWIPKWKKNNFNISNDSENKRPHSDLLEQIASISTNINLNVNWQANETYEMSTLSNKVDELLRNKQLKDNTNKTNNEEVP